MKKDYWIDIHELRFWQSGDKLFLDFHLILPYYFNIKQTHQEENNIEEELKNNFPKTELKIHLDFCVPELCKYCNYSDCQVRTEAKSIEIKWDENKLSGGPIYLRSKTNYYQ